MSQVQPVYQQTAAVAGMGNVKKFFESQKSTLMAVLPQHVSADRMLKIALGAMRTTPKLHNCTIESLFGAVVQCSQLGLEPNTPLGHAFLIPFENKRQGKTEVQIVFGYKGLVDLARRSGQIISISAHEVCANDVFEFEYGLEEKLTHRPAMLKPRGEVVAFYAVAKMVGGGHAFEVMSRSQVEDIRDASQNYKFAQDKSKTVWGQHFVEMGRKTVLRRLIKYLPVSIELATASALDSKAEHDSQALDNVLTGEFEVVDNDSLATDYANTTAEETKPALPTCSDEAFNQKSSIWKKAIAAGKTPSELMAMIQTKELLTDSQKQEITSWAQQGAN